MLYTRSDGLNPATRLALAAGAAILVLGTKMPAALGVEAIAMALVIVAVGRVRAWLSQLRLLLPMLVLLAAITWLSVGPIDAGVAVARLVLLSAVFLVLFQTTAPEDLGDALTRLGLPRHLSFILTSAIQFVPVLQQAASDVVDAQRSRGIRLEGDLASVRNYPALLVPLIVHAFKLADDLAEALESRGYSRAGRTVLGTARFRAADYFGLAGAAGMVVVAFFV
ncbi:MAG: energy-coupling factor transporter transmembrane component T [Anaerolineae bacterium]